MGMEGGWYVPVRRERVGRWSGWARGGGAVAGARDAGGWWLLAAYPGFSARSVSPHVVQTVTLASACTAVHAVALLMWDSCNCACGYLAVA